MNAIVDFPLAPAGATTTLEQVSLRFCQGSSDKVYHAQLIQHADGLCDVTFQYGRYGSTLTTGSKTPSPVELAKAKKVYDKLVAEKTGKGYTSSESGVAYQNTSFEERVVAGMVPQLLNEIGESDMLALLEDDRWLAQEKHNGERRMVRKDTEATGVNKKGLAVALTVPIASTLAAFDGRTIEADGEQIDDTLYLFDVLFDSAAGGDLRGLSCEQRVAALEKLRPALDGSPVKITYTAYTTAEKKALYEAVKARNGEGLVFKLKASPYEPGCPASGGTQLKFKFWKMATVRVSAVNDGKRSVAMEVFRSDGMAIAIGNVTIPANKPIPAVGTLLEVRYLYAYPNGSLFQPTYQFVRTDSDLSAARESQLYYIPDDKSGAIAA